MSDVPAQNINDGYAEAPEGFIGPAVFAEPPPRPTKKPVLAAIAGERVISPVAGSLGSGKGGRLLAFLGLIAGCGVFFAASWTHPKVHGPRSAADEPVKQVIDFASVKASGSTSSKKASGPAGGPPTAAPALSEAPTLAAPGAGAPSLTSSMAVPAIALGGASAVGDASAAAPAQAAKSAADAKTMAAHEAAAARLHAIRSAPLLAYNSGAPIHSVAGQVASPVVRTIDASTSGATELDQLRRGSAIGLIHATRLPNPNFLLSAGAVLPCVLETALDTSAPGFVTCRVPKDIYSDNGGVVLLEKGSRVIGEYRSGFQQGRARIFVVWDRITTTSGVAVDVSSPATDALGTAGFDGKIDSHFWRRFGGALLLTTVQGAMSAAATADARFASIGQAPNEAATVALQNSINIPPTLTKPQGSEVAIFVSRDLDFSSVYALQGR